MNLNIIKFNFKITYKNKTELIVNQVIKKLKNDLN